MYARSADVKAVADRLHSAAIHLLRTVARADAESGISAARLSVLSVVVYGGARTVGELAAVERVRSPSMTALVNGMERDGLVRRLPDPEDRRAVRVEASERGAELLARARARRLEALETLLDGADADDLAALDRAVDVIERALAKPGETA